MSYQYWEHDQDEDQDFDQGEEPAGEEEEEPLKALVGDPSQIKKAPPEEPLT